MEKKIKYSYEDIILKSPGSQIKDLIIERYGSIDAFAEANNLYSGTVIQYLNRKNLGSASFNIKLINSLNMDYNQMYKTIEDQIKQYVRDITENIELYNRKDDVNVLEKLKNMCFEREMLYEYALICRDYGVYYYNQGTIDRALAYMELAINYFKQKKYDDKTIEYVSELILMYIDLGKIENAHKRLELVEKYLTSNDSKSSQKESLLITYLNLGQIYSKLAMYSESIYYINKALEYSHSNKEKAMALISIGQQYKLLKDFASAKRYYKNAGEFLNKDNYEMNYLMSNLAELYYEENNLFIANKYIDKLFSRLDGNIFTTKNKFLYVYAKIKLKLSLEKDIIDTINNCFDKDVSIYIYTAHHVNLIEDIIDIGQRKKVFLSNLKESLVKIIKFGHIKDIEIQNKLKKYIGDITLLIDY